MERPQEGLSGAVAGPSAVAPHAATKSVDSTPEGAATGLLSVGGAEMDVEADAAAGYGAEQNGARWTKRQSSGACARRGVPKLSSSVYLLVSQGASAITSRGKACQLNCTPVPRLAV